LNPNVTPLAGPVLTITGGNGVDVLLEVSGSEAALKEALPLVTPGPRVAPGHIHGPPVSLNEHIIFRKLRVRHYRAQGVPTWHTASRLIASRRIDSPARYPRAPAEFEQGFKLMRSRRCGIFFRP
jgi:threonine 3-dehydrogenase